MKDFGKRLNTKWFFIVTLLLLCLPAVWAFMQPGFPRTDDGGWMIIRSSAFYSALKDGQFPVRWLSTLNNGYGYPVANFLYPGFLYLSVPLAVITSNFVLSIKLLFIGGILFSGLGVFLWLSQRFNLRGSLVGCLIYVYAPYHLYDATRRGSLGEILAFAIFPFILYALEKRLLVITAFLVGLLLISHNTLAIMLLPLIVVYHWLVLESRVRTKLESWLPFLLGVGMATFFWLPAVVDLQYTIFSQTQVSAWKEYFASIQIVGVASLIILLGSLVVFLRQKKIDSRSFVIFFLVIGDIALLLSNHISTNIWQIIPVQFIQFPFRFLAIVVISCSFLAAWLVSSLKRGSVLALILLGVTLYTAFPYLNATEYTQFEEGYYTTNQATTTVKNEYLPKNLKVEPTMTERVENKFGTVQVTEYKSNIIQFKADMASPGAVLIHQLYFPGWQATVDGKSSTLSPQSLTDLMQVGLPIGEHEVILRFRETGLRLLADLISLLSLLAAVVISIKRKTL